MIRTNYGMQKLDHQIPTYLNKHPAVVELLQHTTSWLALKKKIKQYLMSGIL